MTLEDVLVDAFWSVPSNNKDGFLEATAFMDPAEPNPGGPYPYQFYWFEGKQSGHVHCLQPRRLRLPAEGVPFRELPFLEEPTKS